MSVLIQIIGPKKKKHNFHLQNWRTPSFQSSHDNTALDGILDEICARLKAKILHDAVFVKGYRPRCYVQNTRRLFHGFSLCQELYNFSLTGSQRSGMAPALGIANEGLLHSPSNLGCYVRLSSKCRLHGLEQ